MAKNQMLLKIEEKYRKEYERKWLEAKKEFEQAWAELEADYLIKLDMTLQHSADAAMMAIDDVFDVNAPKAEAFHKAHVHYVDKMAHMAVVEDDDPELVWTKDTVDRRLLQIVGKENFQPWDERYKV